MRLPALTVLLALAACGDSGTTSATSDATSATQTTPGTTEAPTTNATSAPTSAPTSTSDTGGTATEAMTGTTGTTGTGTTTSGGTDGTTPPNCGDNVLQADEGEQCDEGNLNGDDQTCHLDCQLDVCGDGKVGPDEICDKGTDNGANGLCSTTCTLNVSQGMLDLDWAYVCTSHLAYNTKNVRIEGLENGKEYNFLLVAYDKSGNPLASNEVIRAKPVDTRDLWEQCHAQGDVCGESGFCNLSERGDPLLGLGALLGLGLGLGGLLRRSTRTRA